MRFSLDLHHVKYNTLDNQGKELFRVPRTKATIPKEVTIYGSLL